MLFLRHGNHNHDYWNCERSSKAGAAFPLNFLQPQDWSQMLQWHVLTLRDMASFGELDNTMIIDARSATLPPAASVTENHAALERDDQHPCTAQLWKCVSCGTRALIWSSSEQGGGHSAGHGGQGGHFLGQATREAGSGKQGAAAFSR